MSVYLCFGMQSNFKAWLIRKTTQGKYSHTWIEYDSSIWGNRMAVHAVDDGVRIETPEAIETRYHSIRRYKFDWNQAEIGLRKCRTYLGKPYDFKSVIINCIVLFLYTLIPIRQIQDWLQTIAVKDSSKYSCSELGTLFLQHAGYTGSISLEPEFMTPTNLERLCFQHPSHFKVEK